MSMSSFFRKTVSKRPRKILLISSPITSADNEIDTYDYFAAIASELAIIIQNRFKDVELVLKVPEGGGKAKDQQLRFIEEAIKSEFPYECIVVSPFERDALYTQMDKWISQYGDNKIIIVDQGFTTDDYKHFHSDNIPRPPYVQADWMEGGNIAARSMYEYFIEKNITCPHIVLVKGKVGSAQRITGFRGGMDSKITNTFRASYLECEGGYSKKVARESFESYLKICINSNKVIDGVFATNDEMALGVREALLKHKSDYLSTVGKITKGVLPVIIGFDGIKDITLLIDNNDDFIYDTVNVKLKEQMHSVANIIDRVVFNNSQLETKEKFISTKGISYRELKKATINK